LEITGGGTPSKQNPRYWGGNIPWASVKDLGKGKFLESTVDHITELGLKESSSNLIPVGRVIVCTRMGLGKIAINRIATAINQDLKALTISEHIDIDYFYNLYGTLDIKGSGMTVSGIKQDALLSMPIPLPPLAEQHRIVAKVDQLMALCDELEDRQRKQQEGRARLNNAALDALLNAGDPVDFAAHWQRICANFDLLYDHPDTIAKLRAAILQLAVQGKLVPQDPNDGATRMVTMEELVGRKNLKNGLSLSPVDRPADFMCLPLSAMKGSTIDCSVGKPIEIASDRAEPYLIKPRDIFIIRGNGNKDRVGVAGMARECPPRVLFPDLFIRVTLPPNKIDDEYFLIAWNSPVTRSVLKELAATTSGIWKVNQGHISECEIPIPPLEEQKRIVAKVDQLMALCDALEVKLNQARQQGEKLMEASVREMLVA
jgi:type I restriction enzyme S subunit